MIIAYTYRSVELQRRLSSDSNLSGISILGVDPGIMPTKITLGGLNLVIRALFFLAAQISGRISPNGMMRLPAKSASDVLAAAFKTDPLFGKQPKGLYFNGPEPKDMSVEAKDAEKRLSVWRASIEYASLKEGDTVLADWA